MSFSTTEEGGGRKGGGGGGGGRGGVGAADNVVAAAAVAVLSSLEVVSLWFSAIFHADPTQRGGSGQKTLLSCLVVHRILSYHWPASAPPSWKDELKRPEQR